MLLNPASPTEVLVRSVSGLFDASSSLFSTVLVEAPFGHTLSILYFRPSTASVIW